MSEIHKLLKNASSNPKGNYFCGYDVAGIMRLKFEIVFSRPYEPGMFGILNPSFTSSFHFKKGNASS